MLSCSMFMIVFIVFQAKVIKEVKESKAETGRLLDVAGDGKFDSPGWFFCLLHIINSYLFIKIQVFSVLLFLLHNWSADIKGAGIMGGYKTNGISRIDYYNLN